MSTYHRAADIFVQITFGAEVVEELARLDILELGELSDLGPLFIARRFSLFLLVLLLLLHNSYPLLAF